jgi:IS1 family transposase
MSSTTIGWILFDLLVLLVLLLHLLTWRSLFPPLRHAPPAPRARSPQPLKPGTPDLCPVCRDEACHLSLLQCLELLTRPTPPPWAQVKGPGGPHRHIDSTGRYCANLLCPYFGITDPAIHALVGDGHYSTTSGLRQNWVCACCGHHVSDTYGTFLYRLHTSVELISRTLTSLCRGQGIRAAAETHGLDKNTVQAWWLRFGERAPAWQELARGRVQVDALQLDELHTIVRKKTCHLSELEAQLGELGTQWIWTAMDPVSKLLLVAQVGPRTRAQACRVIHALCQRLVSGCVPAFCSDGLKHYWYALTAHFGHWRVAARGQRIWEVASELLYAQVVKKYRRRQLTHVLRRVLLGTAAQWAAAMAAAGTRGSINTAFVERLNLTLRQGLAALTRRSQAIAKTKQHLQWRLNAYLVYYNLVREHLSLGTSPACAAGLTDHVWSWAEVLTYRLPPAGLAGGAR